MQMDSGKNSRQSLRRFGGVIALISAALLAGCDNDNDTSDSSVGASVMQAAWMRPPVDIYKPLLDNTNAFPEDSLDNQTVRQIMHISAGGDGIRVRVSNLYGAEPLKVGSVSIARSLGEGLIDIATNVALTFKGSTNVTIGAGEEVWSDVIPFTAPKDTDVAISMYIPEKSLTRTMHPLAGQPFYLGTGNTTTLAQFPAGSFPVNNKDKAPFPLTPTFWITDIDVRNTTARGVVVSIGDSITDGGSKSSYPAFLSSRLATDEKLSGFSVVNAGIGGNRLLSESLSYNNGGERLLNRFERDALNVSGVSHIIVMIGINDIGGGVLNPAESHSVEEFQSGLQQLVDKAKAKNIKIFLGTVMPFEGASYYALEGETKRQTLNTWIRANHARANGIIDFDAALRDPTRPTQLLPLYDSGDRLHPGEAGYEAMAKAVELKLLH